jgi:hypothetical protein
MKTMLMILVATTAVLIGASVAFTPTTKPALAAPGAMLAFGNPPPVCPPVCPPCPPACGYTITSKPSANKHMPKRRKPIVPQTTPATLPTTEE